MTTKKISSYKPGKSKNGIVFFHYWEDGAIQYQGVILELHKDYTARCGLFNFIDGGMTETINVTRAFFDSCTLYDSDYQMRQAYDSN